MESQGGRQAKGWIMRNIIYNVADIRKLKPCYDPVTGLDPEGERKNKGWITENWEGTLVDILGIKACPPQDRLWLVLCWLDARTLRLFAVWCARQALMLVEKPDPRSIAACDVSERYANGEAKQDELVTANVAAWAAAGDVDRGVARAAAWAAARAAAWTVDRAVARAVAWDAANVVAWAAAGDAARDAAGDAQISHLQNMIIGREQPSLRQKK